MPRTTKFIKWPGSKTAAAPIVGPIVAKRLETATTLVVPFAGSLALCQWLHAHGHLEGKRVLCNDYNPWLINAWRVVRDEAASEKLVEKLEELTRVWHALTEEGKEEAYLNLREKLRGEPEGGPRAPGDAALFLFFNRTCFNGIWRESVKSGLNVPIGKRANGGFLKLPNWEKCIEAGSWVRDVDFEFCQGDFRNFLDCLWGDRATWVVYADPPYYKKFVNYNKLGFKDADQMDVIAHLESIADKGGCSILSNSADLVYLRQTSGAHALDINKWTYNFFDSKTSVSCAKDKGELKEILAVLG